MNSLITLQDVWKIYKMGEVEVPALRGVSLVINKGEFVAITGPSGSGKSTMMNVVGALDVPSKGEVYLKEKNIAHMDESDLAVMRGRTIGFIFQQFNLLPTFSALNNVMVPLMLQDVPDDEAEERARKALDIVGLSDRINHYPSELSGGQQQRVAIARALVVDPDIILADEPTGNLDSATGHSIMDFLSKMHKEKSKTIVIISHDTELIKYAERIVHLKDGRVERIEIMKGKRGKT